MSEHVPPAVAAATPSPHSWETAIRLPTAPSGRGPVGLHRGGPGGIGSTQSTDGPSDHDGHQTTRRSLRSQAARTRERRLRRTLVITTAVLLVGAGVARWAEASDSHPADTAISAASTGDPASLMAAASPASPSAAAAASAAPAQGGSVTAHADADEPEPTPAAPTAPGAKAVAPVVVPAAGAGTITPQAIPSAAVKETGRTVDYSVEVEDGLPGSPGDFAATVQAVLTDPHGWQSEDSVRFVPVSPAELAAGATPQIRVTLASPTLTAQLCAPLDVSGEQVSCFNNGRAVLNLTRWLQGSVTYGADLAGYRDYLISHEVGHGIGHSHEHCPGPGQPAPVMVQQTKSLEGCTAWPWPERP